MSLARTYSRTAGRMAWLFAAIGGSLWGGNLVANGSFSNSTYTQNNEFTTVSGFNSQGVSNWTGTGYCIYFFAGTQTTVSAINQWNSTLEKLDTASTALSADGGNFIALDADKNILSTVSQTLTNLVAGRAYNLTFYWAASQLQSRTGNTDDQVLVSLQNTSTLAFDVNYTSATATIPSQGFVNWAKVNLVFVASGSSETLKFLAKSTTTCLPPMVLLDGVSITQAPEPGTMALLGLGTALILLAANRRRRPAPPSIPAKTEL